jgi:cytochrome P450
MIAEVGLSLFLVWFVRYLIITYLKRRNMPPGPFPYPFIGNAPQMMCDPVFPFAKLAEKFGDIYTLTFPSGDAIVLNSVSLIRDARLGRKDDLSGKQRESVYPQNLIFSERGFIAADFSPAYLFRKRVFVSALHLFGSGVEHASKQARKAVDLAIEEIDSKQGLPISPKNLFATSISAQVWVWLTSSEVSLNDQVIKDIIELGDIMGQTALFATLYQLLPMLVYLPTRFSRRLKRAQQLKKRICPPEFKAHKETFMPGVIRDITDSLISAYEKEIAKETSKDIGSIEDIPGIMLDIILAGMETTSSSMSWFMLYMILNPDMQEIIQKEIDLAVGGDRTPCWNDAENMPYLQAVLCEVQRAVSLVVLAPTTTRQDVTIAGYHIPKGTAVLANLNKAHHDEREWPEPEKFKPERFLDSGGKFVGWSKIQRFIPFGLGRRECAGQSLAKIMMVTFAANLLQRYKFESPEGAEIPTTEVIEPHLVMRPQDFEVVAKERCGMTI